MHSFLADSAQPYPTAGYATFVAEVASTVNENLFLHHMLGTTSDDATRLFLLGSYLENLRTTLFRQVLFAELELDMHTRAEKGEPVTGEWLNQRYLELLRAYYGDAAGVCKVDALYGAEWAYIEHFYYDFYVYQYATSVVASLSVATALRDGYASGDTKARDAYLAMLAAGGSRYPVELLRSAGVDMTTPAPFAAAMVEVNRIMDEMEAILAKTRSSRSRSRACRRSRARSTRGRLRRPRPVRRPTAGTPRRCPRRSPPSSSPRTARRGRRRSSRRATPGCRPPSRGRAGSRRRGCRPPSSRTARTEPGWAARGARSGRT
jgi:oligoendopeptidase F